MHCSKCGKEISEEANFCSYCGAPPTGKAGDVSVVTGNRSVNVGVGNLPNANIRIVTKDEPANYTVSRLTDKKLPFKATWSVVIGVLGLLGSIASIYSVLPNDLHNNLFNVQSSSLTFDPILRVFLLGVIFVVMLLVFSVMLSLGGFLLKTKFLWLQFFGFELDKNGFIHFTRLKGQCPSCGSLLSVKYSTLKGARMLTAICSRNFEQHRFPFDPTKLDEL